MSKEDVVRARTDLENVTVAEFEDMGHQLYGEETGYRVIVRMIQFLESLR